MKAVIYCSILDNNVIPKGIGKVNKLFIFMQRYKIKVDYSPQKANQSHLK